MELDGSEKSSYASKFIKANWQTTNASIPKYGLLRYYALREYTEQPETDWLRFDREGNQLNNKASEGMSANPNQRRRP